MDLDDLFPRKKSAAVTLGEDISRLSIPDLDERLVALAAERSRVEEEIHKRKSTLEAAEKIFKKSN